MSYGGDTSMHPGLTPLQRAILGSGLDDAEAELFQQSALAPQPQPPQQQRAEEPSGQAYVRAGSELTLAPDQEPAGGCNGACASGQATQTQARLAGSPGTGEPTASSGPGAAAASPRSEAAPAAAGVPRAAAAIATAPDQAPGGRGGGLRIAPLDLSPQMPQVPNQEGPDAGAAGHDSNSPPSHGSFDPFSYKLSPLHNRSEEGGGEGGPEQTTPLENSSYSPFGRHDLAFEAAQPSQEGGRA
jgi:hypothetical protein